jgi:hypothetical protein
MASEASQRISSVRAHGGQRALRSGCDCRRRGARRELGREHGPLLGDPRGWRQLRRRHFVRVPTTPGRGDHGWDRRPRTHAARDVFCSFRELVTGAPDELGLVAALVHAPDGSGLPLAALAVCHAGDPQQAERDLAPILGFGSPVLSQVGAMPYPEITSVWTDPAGTEENVEWTRDLYDALRPFLADRRYVNYLSGDDSDAARTAYARMRTERRVDGHHWRPPCAVEMASGVSARAISARPRPRAYSRTDSLDDARSECRQSTGGTSRWATPRRREMVAHEALELGDRNEPLVPGRLNGAVDDRTPERRVFQGVGADRFRTAIARACSAGVPTFSPHDLRHRRISLEHLRGQP